MDARVEAAIAHWAPRFLANGVDPNDFNRLTSSVKNWSDWCRIWSEAAQVHMGLAEEAVSRGRWVSAGEHFLRASVTFHFAKFLFFDDLGEAQSAAKNAVQAYAAGLPLYDWPGERVRIPYGEAHLVGILRKPSHIRRPPLVILLPGLDSVKEELHRYGNDFLRRGMATLALDGPGQGEGEVLPLTGHYETAAGAAIDAMERRDDVDATRIGVMGVSLGGYFAVRSAAFESRIRAVISNGGSVRNLDAYEKLPSLTKEAYRHRLKASDDAEARRLLEPFNVRDDLHRIRIPFLIIHGMLDRLRPVQGAKEMAEGAKGPTALWIFEDGNHVCNNVTYRHRPAQADWMWEALA